MASHWGDLTRQWARIGPPLRPNAEVVEALAAELADHRGPTLLLGVTPELADIAPDVTAVERHASVIANVWPGDTSARRAIVGDWCTLGGLGRTFVAAAGDCPLNNLAWPDGHAAFYAALDRVLEPGARFASRVFMTPDRRAALTEVKADAMAGRAGTFHGFKWRLAMAIVSEARDPNIAVETILDTFDELFPDRESLSRAAGWSAETIATIDVYRGSPERYCFPERDQFVAVIPSRFADARWVAAGTYDLAERCPLLVIDHPG